MPDFIEVRMILVFVEEECGGRMAVEGLSTAQFCEEKVKPYVKQRMQCGGESLASVFYRAKYLQEVSLGSKKWTVGPLPGKGRFISHGWGAPLLEVIDALVADFGEAESIWFDVCCHNQLSSVLRESTWWASLFFTLIRFSKEMDMVVHVSPEADANTSNPLNRLWCQFEGYTAAVLKVKFRIILTNTAKRAIRDDAATWIPSFRTMDIGLKFARCSSEPDRKSILQQLELKSSMQIFDTLITFLLRDRLFKAMRAADLIPPGSSTEAEWTRSLEPDRESHDRALEFGAAMFSECAFKEALARGDIAAVQEALDGGKVNLHFVNEGGQTALHCAAVGGLADVVARLLSEGMEPTSKCNAGQTPLHLAANGAVAVMMLDGGCGVDEADKKGDRPLHCAARGGLEEVVALLLRRGADVNARNQAGHTALHSAAAGGHQRVGALLLDAMAEVDSGIVRAGGGMEHVAAEMDASALLGMVRALAADAGASVETLEAGCTPVMMAAWEGHAEMARLLAARGADLGRVDKQGCSAVHYAAWNRQLTCLRALRDLGADIAAPTADPSFAADLQWSAADYAYWNEDKAMALYLEGEGVRAVLKQRPEGWGALPRWLQPTTSEQREVVLRRAEGPAGSTRGVGLHLEKGQSSPADPFRIVRFTPGSPAQQASAKGLLRRGEWVHAANGVDLRACSYAEVVQLVPGAPGTCVTLVVSGANE